MSTDNKNLQVLDSFVAYCYAHPEQRFWQALRNWSKYTYILGYEGPLLDQSDRVVFDIPGMENTFHFEGFEGTKMVVTDERDGMPLYQY